ncbi:hypothetical protein ACFVHW_04350 [Streptomyces sp. NPDC127110]|uniref:hypothetical protein n=1 Tax=Streptomyces sp. NPDC127110 TaxID=3345362 RepID=UPI00364309C4
MPFSTLGRRLPGTYEALSEMLIVDPTGDARHETHVTITQPGRPEPVAHFTVPASHGQVSDEAFAAEGWYRSAPWESIGNDTAPWGDVVHRAYRTTVEPLHALITAGQYVVRSVETHASRDGLIAVYAALGALPVNLMDDQADISLHDALRAVSLAEDAEEWDIITAAEQSLTQMLFTGAPVAEAPALRAVVRLLSQCAVRSDSYESGSVVREAWKRADAAGTTALEEVLAVLHGALRGPTTDRAATEFLTAARRATAYQALFEARRALAEAARAYGLFVIGLRQPLPRAGLWQWARRIGPAEYQFRVERSSPTTHPHGAVVVRRVAGDGTVGPMRQFPLSTDDGRRRAVIEAQYRI